MASGITIKDVAKKAGVSITTVSFVLNGRKDKVSAATVERVLSIAKELGYEPDASAITLRTKKTHTIGFILPDLENGYYAAIVKRLETALSEKSYTLLIGNSNNSMEKDLDYLREFASRHVDYVVYIPSQESLQPENQNILVKELENSGLNYLILDRETDTRTHWNIVNDDVYGATLAVEYLLKNGYRHIACVTGPDNVSSSKSRLHAYRSCLAAHGIAYESELVKEGNYDFDSGVRCVEKLLEEKREFDAIFAFNDLMAYGAYSALQNAGIQVGEQVGVVGYDDLVFSTLTTPPLTSVKPDLDELVRFTVNAMLSGGENKERIYVKPSLSVRRSAPSK